jgi:hypothetical protein
LCSQASALRGFPALKHLACDFNRRDFVCVVALANRIRGYTSKTRLRGFKNADFSLVREGGLCLCSRDFNRRDFVCVVALATRSRGYTSKTRLRGFKNADFSLVRLRGLRLCSRDFNRRDFVCVAAILIVGAS